MHSAEFHFLRVVIYSRAPRSLKKRYTRLPIAYRHACIAMCSIRRVTTAALCSCNRRGCGGTRQSIGHSFNFTTGGRARTCVSMLGVRAHWSFRRTHARTNAHALNWSAEGKAKWDREMKMDCVCTYMLVHPQLL